MSNRTLTLFYVRRKTGYGDGTVLEKVAAENFLHLFEILSDHTSIVNVFKNGMVRVPLENQTTPRYGP